MGSLIKTGWTSGAAMSSPEVTCCTGRPQKPQFSRRKEGRDPPCQHQAGEVKCPLPFPQSLGLTADSQLLHGCDLPAAAATGEMARSGLCLTSKIIYPGRYMALHAFSS